MLHNVDALMNSHNLLQSKLVFGSVLSAHYNFQVCAMVLLPCLVAAVLLLFLVQQLSYWKKKGMAPGPVFVFPLLGNVIRFVKHPAQFWEGHAFMAQKAGYSVDFIFGRFVVFVRESELCHRVFTNVKPDGFTVIGHPVGKKLFGDKNLIYLHGQEHRDIRAKLAPNFTPKALSTYVSIQYRIILEHFHRWDRLSSTSSPVRLRELIRDMNLETSQEVFAGLYLGGEERKRFCEDYHIFNVGLLGFPLDLPGFAFRRARFAFQRLHKTLTSCASKSKTRMCSADTEPCCLVDFMTHEAVKEIDASLQKPPPFSSDGEIGTIVLDFLYASQDASTSSLLWAVTYLESHPDVLAKVREEVSAVWLSREEQELTAAMLREFKYTQAVVREVIRIRAPASTVPHVANSDFRLTENYTIPKGSIVFPSMFASCLQGFSDPFRFDPERFSEKRREDETCKRNFLAFGAGPHHCVGQRYALNHLLLFVVMFSSYYNFKRDQTPGCDDIIYTPTISPKDGCSVLLGKRDSVEL